MIKNAIDSLMEEHQLILQVLASLETLVNNLRNGISVAGRQDLSAFVRFFRDFADKCHHCKEEDRLFIAMNKHGFPKEYGPVAVMLSEHTMGRFHVKELLKISQGSGPLTPGEIQGVITHASEFIPLLSAHIGKEDNILYPMARNAIPAAQLAQLDSDCEAFEHQVMAAGEVIELHELAARLIATYPPAEQSVVHKPACVGCCH